MSAAATSSDSSSICAIPAMKYRYLGGSRLLVSELSLGCWVTFEDRNAFDKLFGITKRAFDCGVNFFDNVEYYGRSEEFMGQVVQKGIREGVWTREDLVLSTKIFFGANGKTGPNDQGLSRKHIIEGTRASLKRMQMEYVDMLFCHQSEPYTPIEGIVRAMNFCIEKGWAFYWGTSDWSSHDIIQACDIADRLDSSVPWSSSRSIISLSVPRSSTTT